MIQALDELKFEIGCLLCNPVDDNVYRLAMLVASTIEAVDIELLALHERIKKLEESR